VSSATDPSPTGELVVRNGKRKGTRLPLRHPATVVGSADGCDVRLTGEGIGPVHCAIVMTPSGPLLRSWSPDHTRVNGAPQAECPLVDGDELKVGPCLFELEVIAEPFEPPPADALRAEAAQIGDLLDGRLRQVAERERQLAEARAAFRRERDQAAADRDEAERLKREAQKLHREAARARERVKRLAARFVRRHRQKTADARGQARAERAANEMTRARLTAEEQAFEAARSAFHVAAAEERERRSEAWAAVESQQRRAAAERAEANDYFTKQDALLDARAAELDARETAVAAARQALEAETAGLRQEAAGLDARVQHARLVVEELERKREQLLGQVLAPAPAEDAARKDRVILNRGAERDLVQWATELDEQERQFNRDRAALASVKTGLDREAADLADGRRVLAEQLAALAVARSHWQRAERKTVGEMEELARGLRRREQELDTREQRLFRADARRRQDGYELWQLRLRLESWQAKLTAHETGWQTEREQAEGELRQRGSAQGNREAAFAGLLTAWGAAREREVERLRSELQVWSDDRERMAKSAAEYDRQRHEVLAELSACAVRALASEQLAADAAKDTRRLAVVHKRWEQTFARKVREIDGHRAALAGESARVEDRYRELQRLLADVAEREAALKSRQARAELAALGEPVAPAAGGPVEGATPRPGSAELAALRDEVERMANVLLEADYPEPPDPPDSELPWGSDEAPPETADVLPFTPSNRAA
jgi:chromosome segregation ATPase